jgi:CheY-like chemotaxis protein
MPVALGRTSEGTDRAGIVGASAVPETAGALASSPDRSADVLIVEDDDEEVRFIARAIQRHEVANRFKIVRSGEEALDYLESTSLEKRGPAPPKVVLLDLKLSGIDGREVLRRMRADRGLSTIPVVVLSSTSKPAGFTIDWITCPSLAATGSVPIVSVTLIGVWKPDALTSFCASATFACLLHSRPFVVVYQGLTGEIG